MTEVSTVQPIGMLSFALAVAIFLFTVVAGLQARRAFLMTIPMVILWVAFMSLAFSGVLTSLPRALGFIPFGGTLDDLSRLVFAFRGITIFLMIGYSYWRFKPLTDRRE